MIAASEAKKPCPWPPVVREFVQTEQEHVYRLLGMQLGLGTDPAKTYAYLARRQTPPSHATSQWNSPLSPKSTLPEGLWDRDTEYFSLGTPTPYEDTDRYPVMSMIFDEMHEVFLSLSGATFPRCFLATLPTGDVNARTKVEPYTGSPVLFFERGLFQFIYDFAMLVGWAVPTISLSELRDDKTLRRLRLRGSYTIPQVASQHFVGSLYAYVVSGPPLAGESPVTPPAHNSFLHRVLVGEMTQFVMAHELAHVTLGHLEKSQQNATEQWKEEYEADLTGLLALCRLAQKTGRSIGAGFWASDLALTCFQFLDEAISIMAFGSNTSWKSKTHPDSFSRRVHLRDLIETAFKRRSILAPAFWAKWTFDDLVLHTEGLFERLFDRYHPELANPGNEIRSYTELSRQRSRRQKAKTLMPYVTSTNYAAIRKLWLMTDQILGRLRYFAFPLMTGLHYQRGSRPSPLWRKRIDRSFGPAQRSA